MAKFRSNVKQTSRRAAPENTEVHGREPVHQTPQQAAEVAGRVPRSDSDNTWSRPTNLTAPPQRPGMKQRWKRVRIDGKPDKRNLSLALQEGWRPRPPDTAPADFKPETVDLEGIGDVISVDDMVLMEMPIAKFRDKERQFAEKKARQMDAVNQELDEAERVGGQRIRQRRRTQVSVGRSRARVVDPD